MNYSSVLPNNVICRYNVVCKILMRMANICTCSGQKTTTTKSIKYMIHLRGWSLPCPSHRVEFIWIPNTYRLNGNTRIECTRFKCQYTASIGTRSFRKDDYLWPIITWICPFNDRFNGSLPWILILSFHINRLREIY